MKGFFVFLGILHSVNIYGQYEESQFYIDGESFSDLTDLQDPRIATEDKLYLAFSSSDSVLLDSVLNNISHVTELIIRANSLKSLGHAWGGFQRLQRLTILCPELRHLPNEIGQLTNLFGLQVEASQLEELPATISDLNNLNYIGIQEANFSEFPSEILNLRNGLYELTIDISRVKELPENFCSLKYKRLSEDDLEKGNITLLNCHSLLSLPANIRKLSFDLFLREAKSLRDISSYDSGSQSTELMITNMSSRKQVKKILRSLSNPKNLKLIIDADFLLPFPRALIKLNGLESLEILRGLPEWEKIEEKKIRALVRKMPDTLIISN